MNGVIKELEMATASAENLIPRSVMGRVISRYRVLIVISLHLLQKPIPKYHLLKSQITSTKLQTNLKFQYPMTQTGLECLFLEIMYMF